MDQAIARVRYLKTAVPRAFITTADEATKLVFAESQLEVPRRTGALAASGHLTPSVSSGSDHSVTISYGPIKYARIVHYNNHHVRHRIGKAYFVIDPLNRWRDRIADMQATAVKVAASGG